LAFTWHVLFDQEQQVNGTCRAVSTLSIIIVEPNAVLGESLKHYLAHHGFTIAGVVDSAQAVATLNDTADETTILLNGARGDIVADFTLLKALRGSARIIVYGGRSELRATLEAIQSGATAHLDDKVNAMMFLKSLQMPPAQMPPQPARHATEVAAARRPAPPFSPREASILQLLREGAPNKLIARQLSLTEATVKVHLKSILRKIRVNNRTQAAVWAMQQDALLAAAQVNGQSK
jgi:two-component system nitrate/nitrite response regulator NarL